MFCDYIDDIGHAILCMVAGGQLFGALPHARVCGCFAQGFGPILAVQPL